jgi:DNA-binding CsgD family transcriptional regulator/tetratricopeptide (TPR) repeat protein
VAGPLGAAATLPAVLDPDVSLPFVARAAPNADLEDAWAAATDGRRRAVFVSGEAGAGKSRLVAEFARTVHDQGGLVLAGSCSPGLEVPYQPFVEAMGALLEPLTVADRRELVGAGAGDLARLLPRLGLTDAVPPPPTVEEPGARRYWLFEAVVELLSRLGCRAPVLLVLEDLHWAGPSTALLVDHLLGDQRLARVCLVATLRSSRQDLGDATAGVLVDLPRRAGVDRVVLEGLGTDQVSELVGRIVGHPLDEPLAQLARHLSEVTAGNPFLIGEQWRQLVEQGRVRRAGRRWQVTGPPAEAASPASVQDLIARTVAAMSIDAQHLLPIAAVAGVSFDTRVVARAADLDVGRALAALEQAIGDELVVVAEPTGFRFRHALVCQALADGLGPAARRRAHLALARALEELDPDRFGESVHHYVRAVPLVEESLVAERVRQAAERARATRRYHDAIGPLTEALGITRDELRRADLLLDLAELASWSGDLDVSEPAAREAAAIARDRGDDARLVRAAQAFQQICIGAPQLLIYAGDLVEDALAVVTDDVERARLLGTLSTALTHEGREDEAVEIGDRAIALARAHADDGTFAEVAHAVLYAGWMDPGRLERQLELCREGAARARSAGHDSALLRVMIKETFGLHAAGDGERLRRLLPEQRRLARRVRQPAILAVDASIRGVEALCSGRLAEAEQATEEFEAWSQRISHPIAGYGMMMFAIRREQGRLAELRPLLEMISRTGREHGTWWPGLAALYAELGMHEDARRVLDRLIGQSTLVAADALRTVTLSYLADAAASTGHALAPAVYAELEPWSGRAVSAAAAACYGSADRYLGRLAEVCGRSTAARRHLEVAVRFDTAAGWPLWAAHSKVALGAHLVRSGRRAEVERGLALLGEAQRTASNAGLVRLAEACARPSGGAGAATEAGAAGSPEPPPSPATSLTGREKDILRLIAEGRTNREVGELLHTSQHTVANQVHGILVKSGCANRAEAIAWAHRHRLLG